MRALYWTRESLEKLEDIESYISLEEHAPEAARAMIERLTTRATQLIQVAHSGRKVADYEDENIRELLERPYRLIYRITEERIEILSVMHYRQLLPSKKQLLGQ